MAMTFLTLTNRILKAFNEVPLDATSFSSAYGFYSEAQDDINRAIFDLYTEEDTKWPFAYTSTTFTTTPGVQNYTLDTSYFAYDWDSFYIPRPHITISSMTKVGTTVTVNTSAPHQLIVGDAATFYDVGDGSTNTYYSAMYSITVGSAQNGFTVVTVPSTTQFTFTVPSTAPSPIVIASSYVLPAYPAQDLDLIDYGTYREYGLANDLNSKTQTAVPSNFAQPSVVVRQPNNTITLSKIPDRVYSVTYSGWSTPTKLTLYSDTTTIPDAFEQIIIDKALHYAYMFRDNVEMAAVAEDRYTKNVNKMRRILIPQTEYFRFEGY